MPLATLEVAHVGVATEEGCCACIQSAACCALLAAVKIARGSSLRALSNREVPVM
jgi:hypothetical protein